MKTKFEKRIKKTVSEKYSIVMSPEEIDEALLDYLDMPGGRISTDQQGNKLFEYTEESEEV